MSLSLFTNAETNFKIYVKLDTEELLWGKSTTEKEIVDNPKKQKIDVTEQMQSEIIKKRKRGRPRKEKTQSQHPCIICNKKFIRQRLEKHMLCHLEEKLFSCELCNKRFTTKYSASKHMEIHSKYYECTICKESFGSYNTLINHFPSEHNIQEKNCFNIKYGCSVCLKSLISKKSKKIHMMEHIKFHSEYSKTFVCSECGQRSILAQDLVVHVKQHRILENSGHGKHSCISCGREFVRLSHLNMHMKTHTGEKQYQCTYSRATFTQ